jgi:hypothetical protein
MLLHIQGYAVDLDEPPRIRVHARLRQHQTPSPSIGSWLPSATKRAFHLR